MLKGETVDFKKEGSWTSLKIKLEDFHKPREARSNNSDN